MATPDFDPVKHVYTLNGVELPSVTEITRFLSYDYKSNQPWLAETAANRGTQVHEACMLIDYGEEPEETPEIEGYVKAYQRFLEDYWPEWQLIEHPMATRAGGYAGTLDRYGTIKNARCIVDLKTGQKHLPALTAQLNGYWWLLMNEGYIIDRLMGLYLRSDGTYELVECPFENSLFNACMTLHKATKKGKRK